MTASLSVRAAGERASSAADQGSVSVRGRPPLHRRFEALVRVTASIARPVSVGQ